MIKMIRLQDIQTKSEKLAIGLISGTSVDGVDAALVKIKNQGIATEVELMDFLTFSYPDGLKTEIIENSAPGNGSVDEICRLNALLGEIFAQAASTLLENADIKPHAVDFIGSHGQTVHHLPEEEERFGYKVRSTLQLGEPSIIAKRTGIITVADFRTADMALGGQGAPLVPYFDYVIFRSIEKTRALVNIGGISNFTILNKNCKLTDLLAYDTGPGNMVIDFLMQKLFSKPYDENGAIAFTGNLSEKLLDFALGHPYFNFRPPKSTGREEFGSEFSEKFLTEAKKTRLNPEDIITTATEFTVRTIWQSYQQDIALHTGVHEFIISGGGARNKYIMQRLSELAAGIEVNPIDKYGIPSGAKEAICFAVLANETLSGNPNNVPSATGAREATILGKICL